MSLTSAQKEEVAVLLGWRKCEVQHADFTDFARWEFRDGTLSWAAFPVTLEAMFAKCRERKWRVRLWEDDGEYRWGLRGKSLPQAVAGRDPDPVAALALALLAAHKEAGHA